MIMLNLIPVWGVWQWSWTPFMVFYMFWFETLIIAFFNSIKMYLSRGDEAEGDYFNNFTRFFKSLRYLIFRTFVFFFYLLFLVVFIGFMIGNKSTIDSDTGLNILGTIMFQDYHFNMAVLGILLFQSFQLVFEYILDNQYKTQKINSFPMIFDARQIVIHIAVIVSAFMGAFLDFGDYNNIGKVPIWYILAVLVFCSLKIIMELLTQKKDSFFNTLSAK